MHFPSKEFDDAVAALCHGRASEEEMRELHGLLRAESAARDEYLLRVELHSRLASEPSLFSNSAAAETSASHASVFRETGKTEVSSVAAVLHRNRKRGWFLGLAASFILLAAASAMLFGPKRSSMKSATSVAVAVLSRSAEIQWENPADAPSTGAALEPGWLRLKSGLVQVAFYRGARLVVEGPARVRLISANEAFCKSGRVLAEVPPQARGFRVGTPQLKVVDLGTEFGVEVTSAATEVHVFKGEVEVQTPHVSKESLKQGEALVAAGSSGWPRHMAADGDNRQVEHYVNGAAVSRHTLTQPPPFRLGSAELGNWNPGEVQDRPFFIRHFSGAMDEFALFSRALSDGEIQALHAEGRSQSNL